MSTIFTKIIERTIPAHIIAEDTHHIAILDLYPKVAGHTLVIPKKEVDYLFDLSDVEIALLFQFAKKVAKKIKAVVPCERIALSVVGLEVPHVHVHLLPIDSESDVYRANDPSLAEEEALKAMEEKLTK